MLTRKKGKMEKEEENIGRREESIERSREVRGGDGKKNKRENWVTEKEE